MSRPSQIGAMRDVWSVSEPALVVHAGLPSLQKSSRSFASRFNDIGSVASLVNRSKIWYSRTMRVDWRFWSTQLATIGIPNIACKERQYERHIGMPSSLSERRVRQSYQPLH